MASGRVELAHRVAGSLAGAVLGAVITAVLEGRWASAAQAESAPFTALVLADAGLLWPVAMAVGVGIGAASLFLHAARAPSPAGLLRALGPAEPEARASVAAIALLAPPAVAIWTVLAARMSLALLASELTARATGAALALGATLLALALHALVLGGARALAGVLAQRPPHGAVTLGLGVALGAALLGWAIATGTTSGSGGTLAIFGVLKRQELDLRAPAGLLILAGSAYLGPALLGRAPAWAALGAALAAGGLTWRASGAALGERRVAIALERDAPLGKLALARWRKLADRDHDGFSARFGGGDCDDASAARNPAAEDEPGNGLDEDCSGKDAEPVALEQPEARVPSDARAAALAALPEKLDVILLTVDTLRFDLGYAGGPRPVTPKIDALARRSVVFEKGYALASYTSKSLAPALIGKFPNETHRGWAHFNRFGPQDTFVAERLQKAGIRTVSVQGFWYFFQQGAGFERGFDVVDTTAAPKVLAVEGDRSSNSDKITDAAIAQLGKPENVKDRFFFWIHYVDPHAEYVKHEGFDFGSSQRDLYDSEIAFVDHHVGRLLEFLEASPLAKRTAIVFTSDHGEAFGEHKLVRHGFEVWEELIRVPLLIYVPGVAPGKVTVRRSGIDLVPTLLDLFRLPAPVGEGTDFLSGSSLLLDVVRPAGYQPKERPIFAHMTAGPNNQDRQGHIDQGLKLITSDGRPMGLYDLEKDPGETRDLLDDAALKERAVGRYKAFTKRLREVKVRPEPK